MLNTVYLTSVETCKHYLISSTTELTTYQLLLMVWSLRWFHRESVLFFTFMKSSTHFRHQWEKLAKQSNCTDQIKIILVHWDSDKEDELSRSAQKQLSGLKWHVFWDANFVGFGIWHECAKRFGPGSRSLNPHTQNRRLKYYGSRCLS